MQPAGRVNCLQGPAHHVLPHERTELSEAARHGVAGLVTCTEGGYLGRDVNRRRFLPEKARPLAATHRQKRLEYRQTQASKPYNAQGVCTCQTRVNDGFRVTCTCGI